jgi:Zn-finger nucleic acid-binding protein
MTNAGSIDKRPCPRCSDELPVMLVHVVDGKLTLDSCRSCGGLWLDAAEWKPVVGSVRSIQRPQVLALDFRRLDCPACGHSDDKAGLVPRGLKGIDELEIDICGDGGGAWLDRGELKHARQAARLLGDERRRLAAEHRQREREAGRLPEGDQRTGFLDALVDAWQRLLS